MKSEYDLAGRVIGLAMRIHSALGSGFLESVYQIALAHEFSKAGIHFESEKQLDVLYDGALVGHFAADFLVENELVVELKAVQNLATAHEVQTVNDLVATGKDIGLLLNFGSDRLEFKKKFRLPRPKPHEVEIHENDSVHSVKR